MVKKKYLIAGLLTLMLILSCVFFCIITKKEMFEVTPKYPMKMNIPIGGEAVNKIRITNNDKEIREFRISLEGLGGISNIDETEFELNPEETKEITINFRDVNERSEIYLGRIVITNNLMKKEVPIFINFDGAYSPFTIIQEEVPNYKNPVAGGEIGLEIKVFDISSNDLKEAKIKYTIKNFDNEIIYESASEPIIIEGKYSTLKIIDIPQGTVIGDYALITTIEYGNAVNNAGYLFYVEKKQIIQEINPLIIVAIMFLIIIVILFIYSIKTRDDLIIQLKHQQNAELRENLEVIEKSKKELNRIKNCKERKKKIKELEKVKTKVIKKVKEKQKAQRKEVNKLKKKGKKDLLKKKIDQWQKEGYKLDYAKKEVKKISKGMNAEIEKFKDQGYKTNFLNE